MKYTNKLNLPEAFTNYVKNENSHEFNPNRFSATELLLSDKEIVLNREHYNELEEDISECVPALMGTAIHNILQNNASSKVWCEASLEYKLTKYNAILSGRVDVLDLLNRTIEDYKTTTTSKIAKADFEDYRKQGLIYAWLVLKIYDVKIEKLKFYCLLKDWSKIKCATSVNYPASPIYIWEMSVLDSDYDYIEDFINDKFKSVLNSLKSGNLPDCSDNERWYSGTKYAVYKKQDDKRALKVCDSVEEANDYLNSELKGVGIIVTRYGENTKCKYYCKCSKWCKQKEVLNGEC